MLKYFITFSFPCFLLLTSCYVSNNPLRKEIKQLQKGKRKDDSSFVYTLPYENNSSHLLVQGYFGKFTHRERAALDFKMKKGTTIFAARSGVVIRLKEDGNKGGRKRSYRQHGNYVIIQHADSSRSGYWHLQKDCVLVNIGDTVRQGQAIAHSGNTGYTAFPHLHFIVWKYDLNNQWQQVATRFQTKKGARYLKPWKWYKRKE
jgi:murein DD-endopeptidase MepM/ murein hydrolase activator NlpD